jgi:UDP-N-acetylmuramoylalanine--D-glutamate ligase
MLQRIAILGAGISGQAARRLALSLGHEVCLFDQEGRGDDAAFGSDKLENFDTIVVSPGFGAEHPWRILAENCGKPCFGELGFAARYWKGKIIGITGTNGKSTLTSLLTSSLKQSGKVAVATGNIGYPLSDAVLSEENTHEAYAVCEISSFQAELPFGLVLDGLIWSNFAEDHLDRYASMNDYFFAKARLFACLQPDAICVLSPQVGHWMNLMHTDFNACSVAYDDPELSAQLLPGSPFRDFPHSENFALAAEFWWLLDLPTEALVETASTFKLASHRLKQEVEWNGVRFWNDSKATNFHATLAALATTPKPIFWIGGGREKGGNVEAFGKAVASNIEAAFLYGEIGKRLAEVLKPTLPVVEVYHDFKDAVLAAAAAAENVSRANVLLSPGFSSFDQFSSYDERGKCFISIVLGLKDARMTH